MNRTLLGPSEMSFGTDNQYFRSICRPQKEVMSGSEVSTHPTENVQKIKRFFTQIKIVEKNRFMKNQQICYFSKEKLLFREFSLHHFTHRVRFSTRPVNIQRV